MQWLATYHDGTTLGQYNDQGESSSEQIDRSNLASFTLLAEDGSKLLTLHFEHGQRLIFRRRVEQSVGGPPIVVYLFGWQQTIHGQNVQSIAYVFNEGARIEWAGKFQEGHAWFYAVDPVPCETEDALTKLAQIGAE